MKRVLLLSALATAILVTACKKDDDKPKSKADMLIGKSWRATAYTSTQVVNGRTVTTDEYALYDPCDKDNFMQFKADKKLILNSGPVRCPNDPQEEIGAWDINYDQTKLSIYDPSEAAIAGQADIVELSASTLKIRFSTGSGSTLETQTATFASF